MKYDFIATTSHRLAIATISAVLLVFLCAELLGVITTASITWRMLVSVGDSAGSIVQAALLAVAAGATMILVLRIANREVPLRPTAFLYILTVASIAVHLMLAFFVHPEWGSDYLRYWQHAQALVEEGRYSGASDPFDSRALLVPYAVVRIFGPEARWALKLTNILLLTVCQLFAYDILRRLSDHRAAQAGALLLATAPLLAYTTLIPSHDLWGLFFLAASVWLITLAVYPSTELPAKARRWIPLALLAGVFAYLAELQRGTGKVFCVALVFAGVVGWLATMGIGAPKRARRRATTVVMASLICFASALAVAGVGNKLELNSGPNTAVFMMKVAAHGSGMGNGTNAWFVRFNNRFGAAKYSEVEAVDFAKSLTLSGWTLQPMDRTAHFVNQAKALFELSSSWGWLLRNPEGISPRARSLFILYGDIFGLMFGALLVYALAKLVIARKLPPFPVFALLATILALAFTLLVIFENKSLNIFPVWFAASLTIACALVPSRADAADEPIDTNERIVWTNWRPLAEGTALFTVVVMTAFAMLRLSFGVEDGRLINNWTFHNKQAKPTRSANWEDGLLDARPEAFDPDAYDPRTIKSYRSRIMKSRFVRSASQDGDRIQKYAGDTVTRLQFPGTVTEGDQLDMTAKVCNRDGDRKNVEYFLFSPKLPIPKGSQFILNVSIDGNTVRRSNLPIKHKGLQRFVLKNALADRACHTLGFRLEAGRLGSAVPPTRTPFAEIWMPRLIP